ncbi:MAG: hypothetical protein GT601_18520, partial [Acidaminobacter sp.]|uniref:IS1096 element passenger TnpR family protein n=1 Tax=Acidaminobacter sp. TaxID=1872102 RepID=UPI00137D1A7A|nr:hypothetical protein [Acidaminobacter sp.]
GALSATVQDTVSDFQAFIHYLDTERPKLTKRTGRLSKKDLFAINVLLKHKKDLIEPSATQDAYPSIRLMFELAQLSKLYTIQPMGKSSLILGRSINMDAYEKLNVFEKYVYLFETFWTKYDFEAELPYAGHFVPDLINQTVVLFASMKAGEPLERKKMFSEDYYKLLFSDLSALTHYFGFFGLCDYVEIEATAGQRKTDRRADVFLSITPTNWGVALCDALKSYSIRKWRQETFVSYESPFSDWLMRQYGLAHHYDKKETFVETLKKKHKESTLSDQKVLPPMVTFLARLFPPGALINTVIPVDPMSTSTGLFELQVALSPDVWRTIRISGEETMETLHGAIQFAFEFDSDHLYAFYLKLPGKKGRASEFIIDAPYCQDEHPADEFTLAELNLFVGQRITYNFDFGDEWRFDIKVLKADVNAEGPENPEIIEEKGKAPSQYGDFWDEDEDEDYEDGDDDED